MKQTIKLMTHVVVGYPSLKDTEELVEMMANCGVDMVELQIPFSDPIADGPTIMKACEGAIRNGTRVTDAFRIMKTLSERVTIPIIYMAYYNTVFRYGTQDFCRDAKKSGAYGLIVPDMAIDEEPQERFIYYCRKYNLHTIQVVSPATTVERLKKNARVSTGFVYATARQGITGVKGELNPEISAYIQSVKKHFQIPIAVGFGISKKDHMQALTGHADIAVVGSAITDVIMHSKKGEYVQNVRTFIRKLRI